jgi:transcriptional regulator with XRE-family HTH domain
VSDHAAHDLANQLRELRARRQWTQADLAHHLGTTPQTVSRWEQGSPPQAGLRRRLDALLRGEGAAAESSRVIQFPIPEGALPPADVDDERVRAAAVAAVTARVASGAPLTQGEIALMRTLLHAVGVPWEPD